MPRESSAGSACSLPPSSSSSTSAVARAAKSRDAVDARRQAQVLLDREVLEQLRLIGHERDELLRTDRVADDVVPADLDDACAGGVDADHAAQRGRLAGAIRPDEADNLSCSHGEREVADGDDLVVPLRQAADRDHLNSIATI